MRDAFTCLLAQTERQSLHNQLGKMFGAVSLGFAFLAAITAFFYSASPVWLDCKNGVHVPFSPYSPSWNTWFHPSRVVFRGREGVSRDDDARSWNILHHLGGHGPWIEKTDGGVEAHGVDPPEGCSVDQVHMVCWTCFRGCIAVAVLDPYFPARITCNDIQLTLCRCPATASDTRPHQPEAVCFQHHHLHYYPVCMHGWYKN